MIGSEQQSEGPVLVFGSFPPVAGPVTAATLDAVRKARAGGAVVRTASARPSGAERSSRLAGAVAGPRLARLQAEVGATELVMAFDDGVPAGWCRTSAEAVVAFAAIASLARGMRGFRRVSLLVATDPGLPQWVLRPLWPVVHEVRLVAGNERLIERLALPLGTVRIIEPAPAVRGLTGHGVTPLGPPEVTALAMPGRAIGLAGRRVFGSHFPWVRTQVLRVQHYTRRSVFYVGRLLLPARS